jgi:hypothetical protein
MPHGAGSDSGAAPQGRRAAPPGARESGAGDQFHVLWAARKAVALLSHTELHRVVLEGLTRPDEAITDPYELLGVDLAEYFGGGSFEGANKVVLSQLKYSSRNPTTAWTAARLARPARKGGASVVRRLGDQLASFLRNHDRTAVLTKLEIRFVSNQPISNTLENALAAAKAELTATPGQVSFTELERRLPDPARTELRRLFEASGLGTRQFSDLLRLLDLSATGADARSIQETKLLQELGQHVAGNLTAAANALYLRVLREALPEGAGSPGLDRNEILATLGRSGIRDLFPAPARFPELAHPIKTADVATLAERLQGGAEAVVAHGIAGIGKTTTLRLLEQELPNEWVVLVYDCFGNGEYRSPSESRHLPSRALLQLMNELSDRCGTPLLVEPPQAEPDLWRLFERRLDAAASVVADRGGRLVIAVDAADNAAHAARLRRQHSFVPDMWQIRRPPGTALVMTARSHRLDDVAAPPKVEQLEFEGFDEEASATHLRRIDAAAEDTAARLFHDRTAGNPRLQFYVLAGWEGSGAEPLEQLLQRAPQSWTEIFEDIIDETVSNVADKNRAEELLATLVAMTRPVPIAALADASGVALDEVRRFCRGLEPGASVEVDVVAFRDEDFDDHLQQRVGPERHRDADERLATYYLGRQEDPKAAVEVGEHLHRSGRHDELLDLALNGGQPMAISEPLQRLETYQRRLELALAIAIEEGRQGDALRALVLAADAATSGSAITAMIRERPELAMRYGDVEQVARIYLRDENVAWNGPLHLRSAAAFARSGPAQQVEEQLGLAEAWLRRWMQDRETGRHWDLTAEDVAAGVEAVYFREGPNHALEWLRRWRPLSFVLSVVDVVARELAAAVDATKLSDELEKLDLPARVTARFHAALWKAGKRPPLTTTRAVAERLEKLAITPNDAGWGIDLCELLAAQGGDRHPVRPLIEQFAPPLPSYVPHRSDSGLLDLPLRAAALLAVLDGTEFEPASLLPERYQPNEQGEELVYAVAEDRRRYLEAIEAMFPAYVGRAKAFVGKTAVPGLRQTIAPRIKGTKSRSAYRFHEFDWGFRRFALIVLDGLVRLPGDGRKLAEEILDAAEDGLGEGIVWFGLDAAALFARFPRYQALATRLLEEVAARLLEAEFSASDRSEALLRASSIADRFDAELAASLYDQALHVAEGINDERARLLLTLTRFAEHAAGRIEAEEAAALAERLARAIERFEPHLSDPDLLPMREAVRATTMLAPAAGFALVARWHDEGKLRIEHGIPPLITAAAECGFVQPRQGLSLLRLAGERTGPIRTGLPILEPLAGGGATTRPDLARVIAELALWIRRDSPIASRANQANELFSWLEARGLTHLAGASDLRELRDYALRPPAQGRPTREEVVAVVEDDVSKTEVHVTAGASDTLAEVPGRLDDLFGTFAADVDIERYLESVANRLKPSERVAFLKALAELPSVSRASRYHARPISRTFARFVDEWKAIREVDEWRESGVREFVETHLESLIGYDYSGGEPLAELIQRNVVHDPATLVASATARRLSDLSPFQLFRVADTLAEAIPPNEVAAVFDATLTSLEPEIVVIPALPKGPTETLASFLFALFADMDKRVRWRAAHVTRAIADEALVRALVEGVGRRDAGPFRSENLPFYWISAQMWLCLVLARLADEKPDLIRPHTIRLAELALEKSFPHVAIREFSRRAALVADHGANAVLDDESRARLAVINEASACFAKRGHQAERKSGRFAQPEDARFRFDSIDTIPYWLDPAGQVFGLSGLTIAGRAEKWIVDYLGLGDDDISRDRRELTGERRWMEMRNDHGSIPVLESLRGYLEYHSMLLAVGELIDEAAPISVETYQDADDPLREWVSRHTDVSPNSWLVDLRTPAPLDPLVYHELGPLHEWRARTDHEFEHELGFSARKGWLTVASSRTVWDTDRHGSSYVSSALVSPDTASALLRALQTTDDPNDYALPREPTDPDWPEHEIDDGEFVLLGWLRNVGEDHGSIEEHDPLRRISGAYATPGRSFQQSTGARPDSSGLRLYDAAGRLVCESELWSDEIGDSRDRVRERYTEGRRTWVALPALLRFLDARGLDLIVKVVIQRQIDRRMREESDYDLGIGRVYLVRRDGTLEGLGSRRPLGSADQR